MGRDFDGGVTFCEIDPRILNTFNRDQYTSFAKIRHYLPEDVRKTNYEETRKKIFGGVEVNTRDNGAHNNNTVKARIQGEAQKASDEKSQGPIVPNKRYLQILKKRNDYKKRKKKRKMIAESIIRNGARDPRPYADVIIAGETHKALLDSGASVSVLGKNCRENINRWQADVIEQYANVHTAAGKPYRILGRTTLEIEYKGEKQNITFYLCPDLEQCIYLGIDFWREYNIAPEIFNNDELSVDLVEKIHCQSPSDGIKMHELSEREQKTLAEVISKFASFEKNGLGCTQLERHSIKLVEGTNPIKDRHYPISPAMQTIVYAEIDKMLELKVIEESESPWNNRTTIVRKPGKNRFCLDARKLNAVTVKDAYPLQNIDGILSRIDQTHYISSVDLKYAFWQIELQEESRPLTAFTVPGRPLYQFRVMPFGLCNAAQRLCRLMDKVIPAKLKSNVFVYLDDLLIISDTFMTHIRVLEQVAECLGRANLTIGLKKSKFCFKELRYLGFIIGGGVLKTDPEKIAAIQQIKVPKSPREVRSFLGTAGWYRRFMKDFASISAPLTDTLKKGKKFTMTTEAAEAFESLKQALTTAPVLRHPDFTRSFYVQCDASQYGVGAVLFQKNDNGDENPIAFYSQKFNSCQRNYSVTEKECLAAVLAVKRFRPYIEMMRFTIITDHASLKWLMSLKDLSGRLARWSLQLQGYNFSIEHRKGSENVVADTLSRMAVGVNELTHDDFFDFETLEFESPEYLELATNIKENSEKLPDLKVEAGKIYKRTPCYQLDEFGESTWKLWVPQQLTQILIEKAHDAATSAHGGLHKTLGALKRLYYWPNMSIQVRNYISNCQVCKECKPSNQNLKPTMGAEVQTDRPFQKLYIDFLGKYPRSKMGNAYIFVVLDHLTKFTFIKAMKEATAKNVIQFLVREVFNKFGVPEVIHSDNGQQFLSHTFREMMQAYRITHMKTAFYSPQSNASERVNQSILNAIRSHLEQDQRDWDMYLAEIECALRTTVHSTIGTTPFFALFGFHWFSNGSDYKLARKLKSMTDHELKLLDRSTQLEIIREKIQKNMHEAHMRSAKRYNEKARVTRFKPGQEVYRRNFALSDFKNNINSKFCRKFLKSRIVKPVGNNMYELEDARGKAIGIYHAKDIKI